jgi:hypothetical protein
VRTGVEHGFGWLGTVVTGLCAVFLASALTGAESFHWEWRNPTELDLRLVEAKVTGPERTEIANAITHQVGPYMRSIGIDSEQQLKDEVLDTRVDLVDLNRDGVSEVIAQGTSKEGCSPTGNCPFWIFQRSGREYKVLVSRDAVQSFQIQRSLSGGFRDIVVERHDSATDRTLTMLRFSRGRYHAVGCYVANWSELQGDTVRKLKEPRLTPCRYR